jgi:RNA polymerase sigma-70 factor (ECF subfamily)
LESHCYRLEVFSGQDGSLPAARPADDDARLVARAAGGDRAALGILYDRFAPSMLGIGQRIVGSAREAEDLVHDVFLEAWLRARYYDPARGSVRTWLMLRLRSRALDRRRSAQRARSVELDELRFVSKTPAADLPAQSADGRKLRGLMNALPEEQRTVLELSYFQGCTCAEIAVSLNVPLGTVKSRMSRAIAHLRGSLQRVEGGDP